MYEKEIKTTGARPVFNLFGAFGLDNTIKIAILTPGFRLGMKCQPHSVLLR